MTRWIAMFVLAFPLVLCAARGKANRGVASDVRTQALIAVADIEEARHEAQLESGGDIEDTSAVARRRADALTRAAALSPDDAELARRTESKSSIETTP